MSISAFLATVRGFSALDTPTLDAVATQLDEVRVPAGEHLIRRGEPGDAMYIVREGELKVPVFDDTGRVRLVARLEAGDVVGEMALLTGERRRADVIAETDVVAVRARRETIAPLLDEHPPLARFLTEVLGRRLEEAGGVERVGKYRLLGKLGEGATAKVYEALHPGLNRVVAVKMLGHHLVYDATFRDRFLDEARTIAGLSHPNIVQVFDTEKAYATWFLVMEKVEGTDLARLLDQEGSFAPDDVTDILRQLAAALRFAHERGIVHRDVKPANTALDEDGTIKLMDFGIARRFTRGDGTTDIVEGTPRYLAPEAILGRPLDGRADIYSLGVMAYELLVGRAPFHAPDVKSLLHAHLNEPAPDVQTARPDVPDGLAAFVRGALQKDPDERLGDWGRIDALLAGGDAADAAMEEVDELVVRVRFRPQDRERVERAVDGMRRRLQGTPWLDLATADLARHARSETETRRKGWLARLGLGTTAAEPVVTRAFQKEE